MTLKALVLHLASLLLISYSLLLPVLKVALFLALRLRWIVQPEIVLNDLPPTGRTSVNIVVQWLNSLQQASTQCNSSRHLLTMDAKANSCWCMNDVSLAVKPL